MGTGWETREKLPAVGADVGREQGNVQFLVSKMILSLIETENLEGDVL